MAAVANAADVQLAATSPRLVAVPTPSNYTINFSAVNGATKPANNADVTLTAVNGGLTVTGGGITLNAGGSIKGGQTDYATGTGFFLGYSAAAYKLSIGSSTNYFRWTGTAIEILGDIAGASNINITGQATFGGSNTSGAITYAVVANATGGATGGVKGFTASSIGYGVYGKATGGGTGVLAQSDTGWGLDGYVTAGSGAAGVLGESSGASSYGVCAFGASGTGKALRVAGTLTWGTLAGTPPVWAVPDLSVTKFMRADGAWADLTSILTYVSSGAAPAAAATGSIVVNTYGGAGQVRLATYAV